MRLRPEGPKHTPLCRPSGPLILCIRIPVAHATGIGSVGPPGLKIRNFKTHAVGQTWVRLNQHVLAANFETPLRQQIMNHFGMRDFRISQTGITAIIRHGQPIVIEPQ
jgi:hypothetical protein